MISTKVFKSTFSRFLLAVLAILALSACKEEREQSMSFHDAHIEHQVVQKMESERIPFRREGNSIWYSIDNREKVQEIFNVAVAQRPMQYRFYDKEKQDQFISLLGDQGITASTESNSESPYIVNVPNEYRDKSEEIFQQVLRSN